MPWRKMRLRDSDVFVRVDESGAPRVSGGRVEIRYDAKSPKAYYAAARNLSEIAGAAILPDDHCVEATSDDASSATSSGVNSSARTPKATAPAKSWFQNRTELHNETQALQTERSKAGWTPVENARRRRAPRIYRATTGGFESSSKGGAVGPAIPEGAIIVYADGACSGNPGPAGLGMVLIDGQSRIERSEYLGTATNNIAELTAVLRALEAAPDGARALAIHTDSQYSIGVLSKGWKAKANQNLVATIKARLAERGNVTLHYVPGHSGVLLNERADELARTAVTERKTSETKYESMLKGT